MCGTRLAPGTALDSASSTKNLQGVKVTVHPNEVRGDVSPQGSDAERQHERRHAVVIGYITAAAAAIAAIAAVLEIFLR